VEAGDNKHGQARDGVHVSTKRVQCQRTRFHVGVADDDDMNALIHIYNTQQYRPN